MLCANLTSRSHCNNTKSCCYFGRASILILTYLLDPVGLPPFVSVKDAIRKRAGAKIEGGKIIKIEAHPIPENYRPRRVVGRMALVGDAAG